MTQHSIARSEWEGGATIAGLAHTPVLSKGAKRGAAGWATGSGAAHSPRRCESSLTSATEREWDSSRDLQSSCGCGTWGSSGSCDSLRLRSRTRRTAGPATAGSRGHASRRRACRARLHPEWRWPTGSRDVGVVEVGGLAEDQPSAGRVYDRGGVRRDGELRRPKQPDAYLDRVRSIRPDAGDETDDGAGTAVWIVDPVSQALTGSVEIDVAHPFGRRIGVQT